MNSSRSDVGKNDEVMSASEFQRKWSYGGDQEGGNKEGGWCVHTSKTPITPNDGDGLTITLTHIQEHLISKGFIVVASGSKNNEFKVYAYQVTSSSLGDYDINHDDQDKIPIFLLELVLGYNEMFSYEFRLTCKNNQSENSGIMSKMISKLDIQTLAAHSLD
mmetsp:Transcript_9463/g.11423  ORF Transcript_9463/g.11423 Transcript_9463/m.11423 type:complete len:162 (+) Transcript_9463:1354-1839(+)